MSTQESAQEAEWYIKFDHNKCGKITTVGQKLLHWNFSVHIFVQDTGDQPKTAVAKDQNSVLTKATDETTDRIVVVGLTCNPTLGQKEWTVETYIDFTLTHPTNEQLSQNTSRTLIFFHNRIDKRLCQFNFQRCDFLKDEAKCFVSVALRVVEPTNGWKIHTVPQRTLETPWEDSDVTFLVEDKQIHAHRQILALSSPVFKAMLSGNFLESDNKRSIPLPGKKYEDIVELLSLLYPHSSGLDFDKALRLVPLMHEYGIAALEEKAEEIFINRLTRDNAFLCLKIAEQYGYEYLKDAAIGKVAIKFQYQEYSKS